jgi:protein arginine kinase activator
MLCQNCNKNEATVRYTQIINGNKKEMMLCEECSELLGVNKINFNMPIDFSSFFGGMLEDYEDSDFIPMISGVKELKCNNCNMTYDEFINTGKLGCPECYTAFSEKIDPILRRIHGSDRYLGRKINKKLNSELSNKKTETIETTSKKEKLEEKLKKAISEERYEDAAKIRDEIKNIKEE